MLFVLEKLYNSSHNVGNIESVDERHRHRYEVNPKYVEKIEAAGLHFVGMTMNRRLHLIHILNIFNPRPR